MVMIVHNDADEATVQWFDNMERARFRWSLLTPVEAIER